MDGEILALGDWLGLLDGLIEGLRLGLNEALGD
jgi:hypothetical protein